MAETERTRHPGVHRDLATGSYMVVVDISPPGVKPRKQAKRRGFRTIKLALAARDDLRKSVRQGEYVAPAKVRLGEFLTNQWLPAVRGTLRRTTFESYKRMLANHVVAYPELAATRVQALTPQTLDSHYAALAEAGLGPTSIRYVHVLIHRALGDARRWQVVTRNVADDADPPKRSQSERPTWSPEQLRAFLAHGQGDHWGPAWAFVAATGCRRGEALGLRWSDVDLDDGTATIVNTVVRVDPNPDGTRWAWSTSKSDKGRRTVALDSGVVSVLRAHRKAQAQLRLRLGAGWRDHDLVFPDVDGAPPNDPTSLTDRFQQAVTEAGLPMLSLHGLRHTWATHALRVGVNPRVVQSRLGHASVAVTLDIYSHVSPGMDREAADRVAGLVSGGEQT